MDEVRRKLLANRDEGLDDFILWMNRGGAIPQREVLRSMELFAKELMPELRAGHTRARRVTGPPSTAGGADGGPSAGPPRLKQPLASAGTESEEVTWRDAGSRQLVAIETRRFEAMRSSR